MELFQNFPGGMEIMLLNKTNDEAAPEQNSEKKGQSRTDKDNADHDFRRHVDVHIKLDSLYLKTPAKSTAYGT